MNTKVMILGAGIYQVPLIKETKERGFEVIVVSPKGSYPGIPLADVFLDIDIMDADSIVQAAKEHGIAGIVTTGTEAISSVGAVVDILNLRGPNKALVEIVSSKTAFRNFLREQHLNHPDFLLCRCESDAWDFYQHSECKVVLKPDDSSGSRGVTIIDRGSTEACVKSAFRNAINFSRKDIVCAETFIEGIEVGGDAFLLEGDPRFFTITCKHMQGVLVKGHSLPSNLSEPDFKRVKAEICRVASRLGYASGPLNFDVLVNSKQVVVLELGLRNGGNGIVELIYHSEGIDLMTWLLDYTILGTTHKQTTGKAVEVSSYVFGTDVAGRLRRVSSLSELQDAVPEVFDLVLAHKPGEHVDAFAHNGNQIGYALLSCGASEYESVISRVEEVLHVEVDA